MNKRNWIIAFIVCIILATLAPLASSAPDGLERVAEDQGFLGMGKTSPVAAFADYLFPGVHNEALATMMAGWLGVIVIFALAYIISRLVRRWRKGPAQP